MQNAAWNDQFDVEWGRGKGDSKKAHAKSYIATTSDYSKGFFMDHSVPNYPTVEDGIISPKIKIGQRKMAQHHFCITIKSA